MRKMNVLFLLCLLTFTEARKRKPKISPDSVDIYPQKFDHPIDFGHVYRDGYVSHGVEDRDPRDMPAISENQRQEKPMPGAEFASPRDEYEHYRKYGDHDVPNIETKPGREKMWLDFPALLLKNIAKPPGPSHREIVTPKNMHPPPLLGENESQEKVEPNKSQYFDKKKFGLKAPDETESNWTTCEDFGRGAKFHPADVLDMEWLPFYVWTNGLYPVAYIHQFMRPTQKIVREYREQYGQYLNKKIDWEQPKLFMRSLLHDHLLIAGDRKGLFYLVMHVNLPEHVRGGNILLPLISIRLKRNNRYLMYMNCNEIERYISVMAIVGEGPTTDEEKERIAKTFNIRGEGQPVDRNVEDERQILESRREYEINKKRFGNDTIRVHRDYGLFPPQDSHAPRDLSIKK